MSEEPEKKKHKEGDLNIQRARRIPNLTMTRGNIMIKSLEIQDMSKILVRRDQMTAIAVRIDRMIISTTRIKTADITRTLDIAKASNEQA